LESIAKQAELVLSSHLVLVITNHAVRSADHRLEKYALCVQRSMPNNNSMVAYVGDCWT